MKAISSNNHQQPIANKPLDPAADIFDLLRAIFIFYFLFFVATRPACFDLLRANGNLFIYFSPRDRHTLTYYEQMAVFFFATRPTDLLRVNSHFPREVKSDLLRSNDFPHEVIRCDLLRANDDFPHEANFDRLRASNPFQHETISGLATVRKRLLIFLTIPAVTYWNQTTIFSTRPTGPYRRGNLFPHKTPINCIRNRFL